MRTQISCCAVALSLACSPAAAPEPVTDPDQPGSSEPAGTPNPTNPNPNNPAPTDPEPTDPIPTGSAPTLSAAEARFSGRFGLDLRISVQGSDDDADAAVLWLQYLDDQGTPIPRFDTNNDGVDDRADEVLAFDAPIHGLPEFEATYTVRRFFEAPGAVAKVEIALQDEEGSRSPSQVLEFIQQPVLGYGDPCDPTYTLDRCELGMGCRGEPSTCLEGLPPDITRLAYLSHYGTPRILVEGIEPDDDMQLLHLEFLNQDDASIAIDMDGDGSTDASTYTVGPTFNENGQFFLGLYPDESFAEVVTRIAVTPIDAFGNEGERLVTDLAPIVERDWNQGCDPRGFNLCTRQSVCLPGIVGMNNICSGSNRARELQCDDAVTLYAPGENLRFFGEARGTSVWEPDSGCISEYGLGNPEGVVLMELSRGVPSLTLTTDFPSTDFDTVLYVMQGMCPAPGADDMYLGCSDDAPGTLRSTLTLTNVPAGDYLVVVDSWDAEGGNFQLSVSTD